MQEQKLEYAGFWIRVGACLIDTVLVLVIIMPLLIYIYGWEYFDPDKGLVAGAADFLLTYVGPAIAVVLFWIYRQATPGKAMLSVKIVDAKSGGVPSVGQSIGRYLGYYVSAVPLGLGLIWVGIDKRKQGWHDKLAGTVVIRTKGRGAESVRLDGR
jgi:uncharacterized RDD family membrane protein YckC